MSERSSEISSIATKVDILEDMAVSTISNVARDSVVLVLSRFAFLIKLIYCIYILQNGRTVGADKHLFIKNWDPVSDVSENRIHQSI